jgi:excisionase family DNA binding protein
MDKNKVSATPELIYFTADEVAARLKVSKPTVYRWSLGDPSMPTLRIGRSVRFPADRLEEWLRQREQGRRPLRP